MGIVTGRTSNTLSAVVPDADKQYEVRTKDGFKFFDKNQTADIQQAVRGNTKAIDKLKAQGIYITAVDNQTAAQSRIDLKSAGIQTFGNNKTDMDKFDKQMSTLSYNAINGTRPSFWSNLNPIPAFKGMFSGGGLATKVEGGNPNTGGAIVSMKGANNQPFLVTNEKGQALSKKQNDLAQKAANGDQAAMAEANAQGLLVKPVVEDAAKKLNFTTAGDLAGTSNWRRV